MDNNVHLHPSPGRSSSRSMSQRLYGALRSVMKSRRVRLPNYDLPIRFRPWFLAFTVIFMTCFALLAFTDLSRSLPLNKKILHFTCFCLATCVFYFIFDVEENARRIWFWRHSGLIFTAAVCFFLGGLLSEIVQSIISNNEFDFGNVIANMLGCSGGLYASYYLEKHYRTRREIARLYRPLDTEYEEFSDDEPPIGTQLLPLYHAQPMGGSKPSFKSKSHKADRLGDVWDEQEELFAVDDESSTEGGQDTPRPSSRHGGPQPPKIFVTGP